MKICVQCGVKHLNKYSGPFCCGLCESKFHSTSNRETQRSPCSHCAQLMDLRNDQAVSGSMYEAFFRVLFYLDLNDPTGQKTLLNFRKVCKSFKKIAQVFASRVTPIMSLPQYITAYAEEFSDFAKEGSSKKVTCKDSARHSFSLYIDVVGKVLQSKRSGPAYIEIFAEKLILFPKIKQNTMWEDGRLFNPHGSWTPEINDGWALGNIHAKQDVRLMAQVDHAPNFWDGEKGRPTALGRELIQLWRAGYRPVLTDYAKDPYQGYGVLLYPMCYPDVQSPPALSDAKNGSEKELTEILDDILLAMKSSNIVPMPKKLTGVRPPERLDCDSAKPIVKKKNY
jgi:hypothetical protein